MSLYEGGYAAQNDTGSSIFSMSMEEITPLLCDESKKDALNCVGCLHVCPFGKRAIELLEKETKGTVKPMNRKQICDAIKRVEAMENYMEAMSQANPTEFVMKKYGIPLERTAKNKIYQWQHNYGTNLTVISSKIREIKAEIAASQTQMKNNSPAIKTAKIAEETPEIPVEEKKPTKRQEEKMSKNYLEKMRADLENEYLGLEEEIKEHKKGIEACEKRISEIVEDVKSIRAVLDLFKKKDEMYV